MYFTLFVLSLKKKKLYKYQMTQLAWTWMVLLIVVGQLAMSCCVLSVVCEDERVFVCCECVHLCIRV